MTEDNDDSPQMDAEVAAPEEGSEVESGDVERLEPAVHLDAQLGDAPDDSGVDEALQAWRDGGHVSDELDDGDDIQLVQLPQLDPGVPPKKERRPERMHNVMVDVTVELGRCTRTVREISELQVQDTIEISKLAGESFEIRVNGRLFAYGEVVVVTDMMGVRITNLIDTADSGNGSVS